MEKYEIESLILKCYTLVIDEKNCSYKYVDNLVMEEDTSGWTTVYNFG